MYVRRPQHSALALTPCQYLPPTPTSQDLSPSASDDPYTRLLASTVLPKLSTAITNAWEPREPEPLLQFLEQWADLLPSSVQRHILDTLVLPKVRKSSLCVWSQGSILP